MKHTWLVGALAGVMMSAGAAAHAQSTPQSKPASQAPAGQRGAPATVPAGETVLGTVSIPRAVMADGKPLPGGRYTVRLTAQSAQPTVPGQMPDLNRWVEFVQGGNVRGREVVSIVPADEVGDTQQGPDLETGRTRVARGSSRVEALKGGEYIRVWINRAGINYLVHLPPSGTTK